MAPPSVIADDGQPLALGFQPHENFRLEPVGVLVFVQRHMLEAPAPLPPAPGSRHLRPVEREVVIVENVLALLRCDIRGAANG
jgi:hypothetical protein